MDISKNQYRSTGGKAGSVISLLWPVISNDHCIWQGYHSTTKHHALWQTQTYYDKIVETYLVVNMGVLFPKLFWPSARKSCSCDGEKTFEIRGLRPRNCTFFDITITIHSNRTIFETECFFKLLLQVS
jgi:hypothetical protein